jgi:hypothetical protein
MSDLRSTRVRLGSIVRLLAVVLVPLAFVLAAFESILGAFLVMISAGGLCVGAVLIWLSRRGRRRANQATADAFGRDMLGSDVINVARLRVAGLGGLGLVLVAAAVALEFELTAVAAGAGLLGGSAGALLLILYRRRSGPLGSSSQGPAARVMLQERHVADERPNDGQSDRAPRVRVDGDMLPARGR